MTRRTMGNDWGGRSQKGIWWLEYVVGLASWGCMAHPGDHELSGTAFLNQNEIQLKENG